jgi:hypothetical protein
MKSKLEIYALAVCFAAVVSLIISISMGAYSIIQIVDPDLTIRSYNYDRYQTNDRFWESKQAWHKDQNTVTRPSEEELTKQRLEELSVQVIGEKREGLQNLLHALIITVVGTVTLFLHWRIAKKAREQKT